jgi:serine/threonine-protein kinase RsbW
MRRGDGRRHGADSTELRLTSPASAGELRSIRAAVGEFMGGHGATDDQIADVELAVSELATNVIRHTTSPTIAMSLARTDDHWVLDVADADGVPALDSVELPATSQVNGRGLYVVLSVMDHVEVVDVHGTQVVRCSRSLAR